MNILVVRGGAIGDFIMTLPALAALRHSASPSVDGSFGRTPRPLEILGYPTIAQLAVEGRLADAVQRIESPWLTPCFLPGASLLPKTVDYFQRFDLIVSYLYDPQRIFQENVRRCCKARYIAAPPRPPEDGLEHAAQFFLNPVEALGFFGNPEPMLRLSEMSPPDSSALRGRWLVAHPGSGSERKNWPEPLWQAFLADWMSKEDWKVLLIGGEAEGARLDRLAGGLPPARIRIAFNQPLADLARLMSGATAFIGHDSGMTHLAAALGLRGCALWGGTNEAVWRPASSKFAIIRAPEDLSQLNPETVRAALGQWLGLGAAA